MTNVYHEPIDIFDRHLYEKGSVVLHTLRGVLGDEQFFRSLQRYFRDNQERSVITQDLASAVETETGRNMDWFFDQWVYRPGHPEFKVSWSWDDSCQHRHGHRQADAEDATMARRCLPRAARHRLPQGPGEAASRSMSK